MISSLTRNLSNILLKEKLACSNNLIAPSKLCYSNLKKYLTTSATSSESPSAPAEIKTSETNQGSSSQAINPFSIAKAIPIGKLGWQPSLETHTSLVVNGVPYNQLKIIAIKSSRNNTILTLTDAKGIVLFSTSSVSFLLKNRTNKNIKLKKKLRI
jgi:hypothetical protein